MFATIYLPQFALQALLRATPEMYPRPIAVTEEGKVFAFTPAAAKAGVRMGLTTTQALARCANLQLRTRSPEQETAAQDALLQCAYAFSPNIEPTAPGVCTLDLTPNRSRNYQALGDQIRLQLVALHLHAKIGVATTPDLAFLAAQHAKPYLDAAADKSFTPSLSIQALNAPAAATGILQKWGIQNVGAFLRLQRSAVVERLGPEMGALWDRASGRSCRLLKCVLPPERFEEHCEFEHEIETLEPLLFMIRRFLDQICSRLTGAYRVTNALTCKLEFSNGSSFEREFKIPAPTRSPEILFRILHSRLENFRADSTIVSLHLSAQPCMPGNEQFELFESALRDPNSFYETIARLCALAGQENVGVPCPADSYKPDAFQLLPVQSKEESAPVKPADTVPHSGLALRRLRPPAPAKVCVCDGRPASIDSSVVKQSVRDTSGPYLLSGNWWDSEHWALEEWDIQAEDHTMYRIARDQEGWFVEGIYD